jgi:hypothetical protein
MDIILGSPNCLSFSVNICLQWSSFITEKGISVLLRTQEKQKHEERVTRVLHKKERGGNKLTVLRLLGIAEEASAKGYSFLNCCSTKGSTAS